MKLNNRFLSSAYLGLNPSARARLYPVSLLVAELLLTGLPLTGLPLANLVSPSASAQILGTPRTQHRLLSLNGQIVKWGEPSTPTHLNRRVKTFQLNSCVLGREAPIGGPSKVVAGVLPLVNLGSQRSLVVNASIETLAGKHG